ncbi:MAG: hypothetical protein WC644_00780 [Ignavibacteria bacterium]
MMRSPIRALGGDRIGGSDRMEERIRGDLYTKIFMLYVSGLVIRMQKNILAHFNL